MITDFVFYLFAGGATLGGLLMVTRRNPVSAVMFLIATLFCASGMFVLLGAHYVAAINVILYAGAIMVLFLFVIMLLNLGHADWRDLRTPFGGLVGGAVAVAFLGLLARDLIGDVAPLAGSGRGAVMSVTAVEQGPIEAIARPLFQEYVVVLEATGLLLLVAIVGTIFLARRRSA